MDGNNREHLYLFSRRSVGQFFARLGFPQLEFWNPVYAYDLFFCASRTPLAPVSSEAVTSNLCRHPSGRLVMALLDKAAESTDRWWAIQRLEAKLRQPGT